MASQLLRIQMSGGGPYGFRLLGGDKSPLTVAKIRPSSKAQVAGLLEGDVILALNNTCSQGLSHSAATSLMESPSLTVHVLRGRNAVSEVDSAMATLGPEVRRLTAEEASALAPNPGPSATSGDSHIMNGSEPYFRLQAPPSGGSLKQMRIARRESRSSDIQSPDDVAAGLTTAQSTPGYYAREERTSTDGGKTTRVVEEVKTEKFGGTTLTKVTKQEFSSYKSSSAADPRSADPFAPEYSIIRSEEHGHPVPLGAASDGGSQLRGDDRGWKTTTSVHKSSVRTEPYEVRIDTTQDPTKTYLIYQDGSKHEVQGPEVGRQGQHPIPAIEIQFHPNESGFGVEAKPARGVEVNPNFEIRVGKEVTFQPRSKTNYEATQSYSDLHPTLKVHEASAPSQSGTYSKIVHESHQSNYGNQPQVSYGSEPQYGYLEKQKTRIQFQSPNDADPRYENDANSQFEHSTHSRQQTRPQVRFNVEPEVSVKKSAILRPSNDYTEPRNKPAANLRSGYVSDPQPKTQSHFGYNSAPQASTQVRFGYIPEHESDTHPQYGHNQEPQPEINSQFGQRSEPRPRTSQPQYEYNKEPQRQTQSEFGHEPETQSKAQYQYGCDPEEHHHYKIQSQFGCHKEPQSKPQSHYGHTTPEAQRKAKSQYGLEPEHEPPKPQSQYGYNQEAQPRTQCEFNEEEQPNTLPQFGYNREPAYPYKPSSHLESEDIPKQSQSEYSNPDSRLYRPQGDNTANSQFGYNPQLEPPFQSSKPSYSNPEPKHKAGSHTQKPYEPEYNTYPPKAAATQFNRQVEAQFHDSAPVTHTPPAQWGKKFPHGPAPGGPGIYNAPEAAYDAKPPASDRRPIIPRQMDRIERVEIATAQKWTPGSKLPTKQQASKPLQPYSSNTPQTGDPRGIHANDSGVTDGYYDQSFEGGWHEATVAGVKNRPNVGFSRVHDPTKQSTEAEQSYEYGNAPNPKYGSDDYYAPCGREEEEDPSGQYGGWPASHGDQSHPGRPPAQGNAWRPSGYGPSSAVEEMDDRSRGFGAPPPPAPPMGGYGSTQPIGFCVAPTPLAPPPPPAAPPIDDLKVYRGGPSSDRSYGTTTLEERVKVANSVAHSVLAPENQNSRGQKIFLRRRENSHKWTTHGPDPVPETPAQPEPTRSSLNSWAPPLKTSGPVQPRPPLPPNALGSQQLGPRPASIAYSDINGRPEEPPSGGSASSYSLAEDMTLNSGKGGRLFAKKRAKADQWASAETTGQKMAPQNVRQGAPPSQVGYGSASVPPSPGYGGADVGKGVGEYQVTNRLKDMIVKPKNAPVVIWNQQQTTAPQSPFAQSGQSTGSSLIRVGSNPNLGSYRQVRFQGTSAISSPSAQSQNFKQAPSFTAKQFGNRATVSQAAGYTDL